MTSRQDVAKEDNITHSGVAPLDGETAAGTKGVAEDSSLLLNPRYSEGEGRIR